MTLTVERLDPVAHLPVVLGVLRQLDVAAIIDHMIPPHPAHILSCGRGVDALVLALLDGHHARDKGGVRLEERGLLPLRQAGLGRVSRNDDRLGPILDALLAANLNGVFGAVALKALAVYAIPTPWLHQDTTTIALSGAYEDEPEAPGAPRPADGHSKDGRNALKQVLLSLGGSGAGGWPLRLGIRDGNTSDRVETPLAIAECRPRGLEGVQGLVADSKGESRRTLGVCLEEGMGWVTLVPRTCAVRHALEAWGQQQPALPLVVENPGRTQAEACRRWRGQRVIRQVEVESREGQGAQAALRFVVGHSSQWAQPQAQPSAATPLKEAEALADHIKHLEARQFACLADAAAAIAADAGRGQGRRGRRPRPWRDPAVRYRAVSATRRTRRARRGRPAQTDPPPVESCDGLVVEVEVLVIPEADNGGTVLATPVRRECGSAGEMLQAYQAQHTTVEPGCRWIKHPAAISPVWLEKPERIAALAMRTVVGLLGYRVLQRQVRRYLRPHDLQLPGHKGETATPTGAVVWSVFSPVAVVQLRLGNTEIRQVCGVPHYPLVVCDALGLDHTWYAVADSA